MNDPANGRRKKWGGRTEAVDRRAVGKAAFCPVTLHHAMLDCILVTDAGATMGRTFATSAIDAATREIVAFRLSAFRRG